MKIEKHQMSTKEKRKRIKEKHNVHKNNYMEN